LYKVTSLSDNVTVLLTETAILPLEDMFRALYNEIEYLKVYFSHIQSPPIQQRFKAEILHPIEELQVNVMQGYTSLFKDAFPLQYVGSLSHGIRGAQKGNSVSIWTTSMSTSLWHMLRSGAGTCP
jgi:hypothetical protein